MPVASLVLQIGGIHRDPWWDPGGRSRRRGRGRRLVTLGLLALILASALIGLRVQPARAATTVNLDQWASTDFAWQNGNLNGNNSKYPEGGLVPFRLAIEGLAAGSHQLHINYDFTAGGHKAYDFLGTWNATNASGAICSQSGGGVSSMCPSLGTSSTYTFPSDPFVADGLSVTTAQVYSAASRKLTMWGGSITSISGPTHAGSTDGNSTADFTVTFTNTGGATLLAWGGHLAQSTFWNLAAGGTADGAAQVSGAPWHMRTLQLDGTGNKNQDRSIQPSAIVGVLPPFALASPSPVPVPGATAAPPGVPAPVPAGGGPKITPPPTSTELSDWSRPGGEAPVGIAGLALVLAWLAGSRALAARRRTRDRRGVPRA